MKKLSALLFALILVLSLSACGSSTQTPISTDGDRQNPSQEADTTQEEGNGDQSDPADTGQVTIDSTVLFEQDGVIVTAQELAEDSIWGMGIKVLIENNSEKNLTVQCNSLIVNNYMMDNTLLCSVAAGNKANDTIYLSSTELEDAGISTISDIVISFSAFDSDTYSTLFDTEEIEIKTSAYGTIEQPAMDDGKELYNQDGIRIIGRYVEEDSLWGAGVRLFIENNYGENIIVQCDNMSVNGFMITPLFASTVNNGRMVLDEIIIMSSDLEENGIEAVEDIELVFKIVNPDTYRTIVETDPIAFTTKWKVLKNR